MRTALRFATLWALIPFVIIMLTACAGGQSATTNSRALSDDDLADALRVEESYVNAWRANDEEAVMATIAPNAVIVPSGQEPIQGIDNIRAFWFPDDGSTTTINQYSSTTEITGGSGNVAYAIGEGTLQFTYELDGSASDFSSNSVHMTIYQRQPDGDWKIARRMWHTISNE